MKHWALLGDRRDDVPLLQTEGSRDNHSSSVTCRGLHEAGLWFSKHHVTFADATAPFSAADSLVPGSSAPTPPHPTPYPREDAKKHQSLLSE